MSQNLSNLLQDDLSTQLTHNPFQLFQTINLLRSQGSEDYGPACAFVIDALKRRWNVKEDQAITVVATADPRTGQISFTPGPPGRLWSTLQLAGCATIHPDTAPVPIATEPKKKGLAWLRSKATQ